jgi:hypothetical protein
MNLRAAPWSLLGIAALLGLAGCPSSSQTRPPRPPAEPGPVRKLEIAYQANLLGEIEPCG